MFYVAKRLEIDYAPAMVGFEFKNGQSYPVFDGIVVCAEFRDAIVEVNYIATLINFYFSCDSVLFGAFHYLKLLNRTSNLPYGNVFYFVNSEDELLFVHQSL